MAVYRCTLTQTANGGATKWDPPKPEGFEIGDQIVFGSFDGVWKISFGDSPFDPLPVLREFGGNPKEEQKGTLVRTGDFPCDCALNVDGQAVINWNGAGGRGDDVRIPRQTGQ